MVSLNTNIHISEVVEVINFITDPDTAKPVEIFLTSTFSIFEGEFYKKACDIAISSSFSPVVANLFMEDFEAKALASAQLGRKLWKLFVDDTFILWPHGGDKLDMFFQHIKNQSSSIKFTMEPKVNVSHPFLDVLISKKDDVSFSH